MFTETTYYSPDKGNIRPYSIKRKNYPYNAWVLPTKKARVLNVFKVGCIMKFNFIMLEFIQLNFIFLDQVCWLYFNVIKSVKGEQADS